MFKRIVFFVFVILVSCAPAMGKDLTVGVKPAPPFVIEGADGEWTGITISLWKALAEDLDLKYHFEKRGLSELIDQVADGQLDVAAAALTITSKREAKVDFSHPFYTTGLGIALPVQSFGWFAIIQQFFTFEFMQVLLSLLGVLLGFGFFVWLFERKHNKEQFGGSIFQGLGSSLWWSAVTMTTVGYGDKAPKTFGGRLVGLIWMFAAIIIISSFTAAITSTLTVGKLSTTINGPDDLYGLRVLSIPESTSAAYLERRNISYIPLRSLDDGFVALANGEADAVVYDAPILRYFVNEKWQGKVRVLNHTFERQTYGFALPQGSPLRESLNRALLMKLSEESWRNLIETYLGEAD